jgi:hypothetical protein
MISPHRDRFFATAEPPTPDPDPEVAELVATLKRAAMDSAYMRNLRGIIPDFAANAPVFDRTLQTSSMRLAAIACARQGFDAGRYATSSACPFRDGSTSTMSDATPEQTTPAPETPPAVPDESALGDAGKRALDAERARRKAAEHAAAEAAAKIQALEAQTTDLDKLVAKVAELEQSAAKATAEATRQRIVNETGLPADLAQFVTGADEEAMRAAAQLLVSKMAPAQKFGPVDTGPKNVADTGLPKQLTRTDLVGMSPQQIVAAQEAGQLADLMAGKPA